MEKGKCSTKSMFWVSLADVESVHKKRFLRNIFIKECCIIAFFMLVAAQREAKSHDSLTLVEMHDLLVYINLN